MPKLPKAKKVKKVKRIKAWAVLSGKEIAWLDSSRQYPIVLKVFAMEDKDNMDRKVVPVTITYTI